MQIKVNGEPLAVEATLSIGALMERLNLKVTQVAVEKNGTIIPRAVYAQEGLMDGDEVEIVQFIGGG